jgi:hypothetical protein
VLAKGEASACKVLWIPGAGGGTGLTVEHVRNKLSGCSALESVYIGSLLDRPPLLVEGPPEEALLVDPYVTRVANLSLLEILKSLPQTVRKVTAWAYELDAFKDQDVNVPLPDLEVLCMETPFSNPSSQLTTGSFANLTRLRYLRLPGLLLPDMPDSGFGRLEHLELTYATKSDLDGVKHLPRLRSLSVGTLDFWLDENNISAHVSPPSQRPPSVRPPPPSPPSRVRRAASDQSLPACPGRVRHSEERADRRV